MYIHGLQVAESPFAFLRAAELESICTSSGFQILRSYLASALPADFCPEHAFDSPDTQLAWLLHRDILHAMTMPIVEMYKEAAILAQAALCSQSPEELEVAFKGEARFAFLWLQCFVTEEEDWCHTRGCPACTALQTLATELTIRGTIAAALMSSKDGLATAAGTPMSEASEFDTDVQPPTQPSLPDFSVVLGSLEQAVDNDDFWGPGSYAEIFTRSKRLVSAIDELLSQCQVLEALVSSQPPSPAVEGAEGTGLTLRRPYTFDAVSGSISGNHQRQDERNGTQIRLKKGKVAKRQAKLKDEQEALIMRMALQCWSAVHLDQQERAKIRSSVRREDWVRRRRTATT